MRFNPRFSIPFLSMVTALLASAAVAAQPDPEPFGAPVTTATTVEWQTTGDHGPVRLSL